MTAVRAIQDRQRWHQGVARRGWGEDSIYLWEARKRFVGEVSRGFDADGKRIRKRVYGRTKTEVRDKLKN